MDLLDRLLEHDTWTTRELLSLAAALPADDLDREFDLALRSVRATLEHIVRNMEVWTDLMREVPVREVTGDAGSIEGMRVRLECAATDLAELARDVRARAAWDATWIDHLDNPPRAKTFGGAIAHVITHSMHHRGQVLHFLKKLGVERVPEGDVLGWERQALGT